MSLRFLYFRDESGVLAVLRVPTKEAWDRIPFKELIKREQFEAPKLIINKEIKNFYDFTVDDFELVDYKYGEEVKNIPVAI